MCRTLQQVRDMTLTEIPTLVSVGATKTIIQNQSPVNVLYALTQNSQEWIRLEPKDTLIVDYNIYLKAGLGFGDATISVTKD